MSEAPDPYLRLHAVRVFVRDQDRALRFYLDKLGFELAFDAKLYSGERWVAVAPPDGTAVLSLVAPDAEVARAQADRPRHPGRVRDRGRPREVPRVAQARRQVRPRAAPAAHQVPAAARGRSGGAASPRPSRRRPGGPCSRASRTWTGTRSGSSASTRSRAPSRSSGAPPRRSSRPSVAPTTSSRSRGRSRPGSSPRACRPRARCSTPAAACRRARWAATISIS